MRFQTLNIYIKYINLYIYLYIYLNIYFINKVDLVVVIVLSEVVVSEVNTLSV